jgi:hypothetical protein
MDSVLILWRCRQSGDESDDKHATVIRSMGAYNTVSFEWRDPTTNTVRSLRAQFKYGSTWQDEYRVGDVVSWGGNDVGDRSAKRVVVDAVLDDEPVGGVPANYEVHVVDGAIEKVVPATGAFDFAAARSSFIVLAEDL